MFKWPREETKPLPMMLTALSQSRATGEPQCGEAQADACNNRHYVNSSGPDPSLVDPGLTAQLECLLDEVVIGKQQMIGAVDAVCDVARRLSASCRKAPPSEDRRCSAPPSPATQDHGHQRQRSKRFADGSRSGERRRPPPGYATTGSDCRAFLIGARQESPTLEYLERLVPSPRVRRRYYLRRSSRGEWHRYSRRGQGHFGCHLDVRPACRRCGGKHRAERATVIIR